MSATLKRSSIPPRHDLRDYQATLLRGVVAEWAAGARNVLAVLPTGGGKCLGRGTPVMLYDGRVVPVEDVRVGDRLMGPDSRPRRVLSLARGRERMYRVVPTKGDPYVVNESHILSLRRTGIRSTPKYLSQVGGEVVNISVVDYVGRSATFKHEHKGWRAAVNFGRSKPLPVDPYFLGLWLGDGNSKDATITSGDPEIVEWLEAHAARLGMRLSSSPNSPNSRIYRTIPHVRPGRGGSPLLRALRSIGVLHNKHIPHAYKTASREDRLALLAGVIDTDGYYCGKGFQLTLGNEALLDAVIFVARSLGFSAYKRAAKKTCGNTGAVGNYWACSISGSIEDVPCRVPRKQAAPRRQKKDVLVTGIRVEPLGVDDYYGFEIDGDRLFLLGDFTVTHNTVCFAYCIANHPGAAVAIAHRSELVSQMSLALAREGVRHRVVGPAALGRSCAALHMAELGRMFVDPNARNAVAGVDTLVRLDPSDPWFQQVSLWVQDEAHHVLKDNKWGDACAMFPNARGLGVTATPVRADGKGLGRHADGLMDAMVVGPTMRELIEREYLTDYRIFAPPSDIDLSAVTTSASGDYSPPKLKAARRESHITGDVVEHYLRIARGKLGITFDTDIESATETAAAFRAAGVPAEVVSSKSHDEFRRSTIRKFRNREVLQLVNVDLFGEGFDLPAIEVVSMARPTQSYGLYCLDPETEVLTPNGWMRWHDPLPDALVAFDQSDGSCRAVPPTGHVRRPLYDGEVLYRFDGPHLDLAVSDKHDLLVRGRSGTCKTWQKQTAERAATRSAMFHIPVAAFGQFPGSGLTTAELQFLGWWLSDGAISKATKALSITQAIGKVAHLASIRGALTGCGFKFNERLIVRKGCPPTHQNLIQFTVSKGKPRGTGKHLRGYEALSAWVDKALPPIYDTLTRDELLCLLGALNLGDGTNQHGSLDYVKRTLTIACGDNHAFADRLQALCVQRGLRCNKSVVQYGERAAWAYLHIRNCTTATMAGVGVRDGRVSGKAYRRSRLVASAERPAFVWCLSNELGTLITRRNGKVAIVGNCQQFGRALRPLEGKDRAIIIDHVGNVMRHGLPDAYREWSLDRRERRSRSAPADAIPVRTCLNPECLSVYERVYKQCPFCGHVVEPSSRSAPEYVDGDLFELDPAALAALRGEKARIDGDARIPHGATPAVAGAARRAHWERQQGQKPLRDSIALWAGWQNTLGRADPEVYRRFYFKFGVDILTAQTLGATDAAELTERVNAELTRHSITSLGAA